MAIARWGNATGKGEREERWQWAVGLEFIPCAAVTRAETAGAQQLVALGDHKVNHRICCHGMHLGTSSGEKCVVIGSNGEKKQVGEDKLQNKKRNGWVHRR